MLPVVNIQPEERRVEKQADGAIEIVDVFYTIQGEGPFAGRPAVFVRMAGCNLKCPLCDTDYTSNRRMILPGALVAEVMKVWLEAIPTTWRKRSTGGHRLLVVFTGGEPFRQDFGDAVRALIAAGFDDIQVETNGTFYVEEFPYLATTIVCSPKTGTVNHRLWPEIDALKYVVSVDSVDWFAGLPGRVLGSNSPVPVPPDTFRGPVYLQPADEGDPVKNKENLDLAVRLCMRHGWTLGVQLHKIAGLA